MKYRYLLVDNDNTLMDFSAAEHAALKDTLRAYHLPDDEETVSAYVRMNEALWRALERGETTLDALKPERFRQLLVYLEADASQAVTMSKCYEANLATHADLMPGAMEFVQALHGKMKIALVSNGISAIQRGRLSRCPYTDMLDAVIISEEVGASKPDAQMVDAALKALQCEEKAQAVFLGDSLTADVGAARNAGIDSIWISLHGKTSDLPTYTVQNLMEAKDILLG